MRLPLVSRGRKCSRHCCHRALTHCAVSQGSCLWCCRCSCTRLATPSASDLITAVPTDGIRRQTALYKLTRVPYSTRFNTCMDLCCVRIERVTQLRLSSYPYDDISSIRQHFVIRFKASAGPGSARLLVGACRHTARTNFSRSSRAPWAFSTCSPSSTPFQDQSGKRSASFA